MEILTMIIPSVVGLFTGGGIIAFWKYKQDKKKDERSFDANELEKALNKIYELRMQVRRLTMQQFESPIIKWRRVNGKFEWVSNEAMLRIFEPLGISLSDLKGKTLPQVFDKHKEILTQLTKLETKARRFGTHADFLDLPVLGRYFTIKVKFMVPDFGITYECELIPEQVLERKILNQNKYNGNE